MRQVNCILYAPVSSDLLVLGGKREGPRPPLEGRGKVPDPLFADKGCGNQTNHAVCHSAPFAHIRVGVEILTNHIWNLFYNDKLAKLLGLLHGWACCAANDSFT